PTSRGRFLVAKPGHGIPVNAGSGGDRALLVLEGRARCLGLPEPAEVDGGHLYLGPRGLLHGVEAAERWTLAAFLYEAPPSEEAPAEGPVALQNQRNRALHVANPRALAGNAFHPVYETPDSACGLFHIEAGRRLTTGPESERTFLITEGTGLVFLEDETTLPLRAGDVCIVQAGYSARLWARGPAALSGVVFQPQVAPTERRTLKGELTKLKDELAKRKQQG
ncbi:MAG TPA: hypothetical protein VNZ52_01845, partial [Candidatus Thermoplasmatota archaeon]|nr:hypothetical protein [Candidatus Thermoplasmatota archaeon]